MQRKEKGCYRDNKLAVSKLMKWQRLKKAFLKESWVCAILIRLRRLFNKYRPYRQQNRRLDPPWFRALYFVPSMLFYGNSTDKDCPQRFRSVFKHHRDGSALTQQYLSMAASGIPLWWTAVIQITLCLSPLSSGECYLNTTTQEPLKVLFFKHRVRYLCHLYTVGCLFHISDIFLCIVYL